MLNYRGLNNKTQIRKRFIAILVAILSILLISDTIEGAIFIGVLVIVFNALTVYEVKDNKYLIILFSVIMYINLSAYVLGVLTRGLTFGEYQWELWSSRYNSIGMKGILVSSCVFYIMMISSKIKKPISDNSIAQFRSHNNSVVCLICLLFTIFACFFGFNGSAADGEYVSNNNPVFEYAILFFVLGWDYGSKNKNMLLLWYFCSVLYIVTALVAGDRSSAFMLLFVITLYHFNKLSLKKMMMFGFLGIALANFIGQYRTGALGDGMALGLVSRGLKSIFMDTAAQSYYTSLTIYEYNDTITNQLQIFLGWIVSIFSGGIIVDRTSIDLPRLAAEYDRNGGGGLFQPYFYLFYGYMGIALGSLLTAKIIKVVYKNYRNAFFTSLKILIPAMSLRWYLYSPTTLFRTCIVNFFIICLIMKIVDQATCKQQINC